MYDHKKYMKTYDKEYSKRPEVIERRKLIMKKYLSKPRVRASRSEYMKKYYLNPINKQKIKERLERYKLDGRRAETIKFSSIKEKYKLTRKQYEDMFSLQGSGCAICKSSVPGKRGWNVDHDHSCCSGPISCGKCVRGIVCYKCNTAMGMVCDNILTLEQMIKYLKREK